MQRPSPADISALIGPGMGICICCIISKLGATNCSHVYAVPLPDAPEHQPSYCTLQITLLLIRFQVLKKSLNDYSNLLQLCA